MSKSERQQARPPGLGTPRSPILFLEDAEGRDGLPRFADLIARRSLHAVARESNAPTTISRCPLAANSALAAWSRLQDQFDTSCIGIIAERRSGIANASSILRASWNDGTGPGAVALLGFGRDLVATCVSLVARSRDPVDADFSNAAGGRRHTLPDLSEWAPMVFFLPEDDTSIGECAGACRGMRSLGIPIRLEVMRSMRSTATALGVEAAAEELLDELDRFFAAHLTPLFPKLR